LSLNDVRGKHLEIKEQVSFKWLRQIELIGYVFISIINNILMLFLGKTLLILEAIKNWLIKKF
jgi:hypothetical protein